MRLVIGLSFSAILLAQGGAPVEGIVTSSATHMGIAGVQVVVETTSGRHVTYGTNTGAGGAFRIATIDQDGEYMVRFWKSGYRELRPGDPALRPFRVAAATGPVRLNLELKPHAGFRGRVLDADGRPAQQVRVELIGTKGNWVVNAAPGKDGRFVFDNELPARDFVLRAVPLKELPPPQSTEDAPIIWAPTYYPDGTERSQASRIVWRGDEDMDGYEIRLRATPVFHIRGTVLDEAGKPVEGATVKLVETDDAVPVALSLGQPDGQTITQAGGAFELSAVRPGDWLLAAEWRRANQSLEGSAAGRVSRSDWEDVKIRLEPPFSVNGTVESPPGAKARDVVLLTALDRAAAFLGASATTSGDGRFELRNLLPGRYRITTMGAEGFYLDSIQFGGQEVLGQAIDIMDGSLPLRVVYKAGGGSVMGSVEHCAMAVLFPADPSLQTNGFVRTRRCDPGGRFEFDGLRPGDYKVAALPSPDLESVEQVLDEFSFGSVPLGPIAPSAGSVRVEAGQSTTVTLKLAAWPE